MNREKPLATVITCTYRRFDSIRETIQSVIGQDYPHIEYIIADDGSDCFPQAEIEQFFLENKRENISEWQFYTNPQNLGTVKNINHAYSLAHGEYIIHLSGDDLFASPTVVSDIVQRMEEKGCDVLATSRLVIGDPTGKYHFPPTPLVKKLSGLSREEQYYMLVSGMYYDMFSGSALSFRRQFMESFGYYDEKYTLWEDGPFLERYLRTNRMETAFDIISVQYQLGGVSTGNVHPKLQEDAALFRKTDRISQIDSMKAGYRHVMIYNTLAEKKDRNLYMLKHPCVFLRKASYSLIYSSAKKKDIQKSQQGK